MQDKLCELYGKPIRKTATWWTSSHYKSKAVTAYYCYKNGTIWGKTNYQDKKIDQLYGDAYPSFQQGYCDYDSTFMWYYGVKLPPGQNLPEYIKNLCDKKKNTEVNVPKKPILVEPKKQNRDDDYSPNIPKGIVFFPDLPWTLISPLPPIMDEPKIPDDEPPPPKDEPPPPKSPPQVYGCPPGELCYNWVKIDEDWLCDDCQCRDRWRQDEPCTGSLPSDQKDCPPNAPNCNRPIPPYMDDDSSPSEEDMDRAWKRFLLEQDMAKRRADRVAALQNDPDDYIAKKLGPYVRPSQPHEQASTSLQKQVDKPLRRLGYSDLYEEPDSIFTLLPAGPGPRPVEAGNVGTKQGENIQSWNPYGPRIKTTPVSRIATPSARLRNEDE